MWGAKQKVTWRERVWRMWRCYDECAPLPLASSCLLLDSSIIYLAASDNLLPLWNHRPSLNKTPKSVPRLGKTLTISSAIESITIT